MLSRQKRLGQNFLHDKRILGREVEYAKVSGKRVLEIGAGGGNLTVLLAEKAKKVIAVEKDRKIVPNLKETVAKKGLANVEIVNADFLKLTIPSDVDVVVSNVPYSVSSPILFRLAGMGFERAVLCLQEEFARRMVAKPGSRNYSRLSVMSQLSFDIELLDRVPRTAFSPAPKVDSRVVRVNKKGHVDDKTALFIRAIFQHRKKTLENAIIDSRREFGVGRTELRGLIGRVPLRKRRVFTLTKKEIVESSRAFWG